MAIANNLKRYLDSRHVAFESIDLSPFDSAQEAAVLLNVPPRAVVHAEPMQDRFGIVLAVIPSNARVDYERVSRILGRTFEPATSAQVLASFRDCSASVLPPLGEAYGVRAILDDTLVDNDTIYFSAGDGVTVLKVNSQLFFRLQQSAWLCSNFTVLQQEAGDGKSARVDAQAVLQQLETLGRLPVIPETAHAILRLHADPHAGAKDLAALVNTDPSLAAQVMRYAASPLFGYRGELSSVQDAIARVLGFDMVMHLALGLAAAKPFRVQRRGPLGLDAHWRHALYSAALAQALTLELALERRPKAGSAYLAGLLHNFGHLLMGHLFKKEFSEINDLLVAQAEVSVIDAETQVLGIGHDKLGARLLELWHLPGEVVTVAKYHHEAGYAGEHATCVGLVRLCDLMLREHGMGDGNDGDEMAPLLTQLGLTEVQTLMVMNRVLEGCEGLNVMAQQIAA
jgi:HD-like signal output (HDOD) protein/prolyl-tRNA editing enzyme YbaK/EbsC (Cys-tRNA(Pro) deacylase)